MSHLNPDDINQYGGEWSIQKLNCVEKYLEAYLQALSKKDFDLWYIDAFSGDGIQRFNRTVDSEEAIALDEDSDIKEFTTGSSLRALSVSSTNETVGAKGFDHFVFIELDETKLNDLKERISILYPDQLAKCDFIKGDANVRLPQKLREIPWSTSARGVCFIDPWATQLAWSVLGEISKTRCDVWLLFPIEALNRLMPRNGYPKSSWERLLKRLYGDDGWRNRYTACGEQMTIFDESEEIVYREKGCSWLIQYTNDRLRSIFAGVSKPCILKRGDGVPKFVLYALVSNPSVKAKGLALRIANHIIEGVNKS